MIVRYVRPLTEQQRALLESTMKNDASHRARMRAHGLLLSSEGLTIKAIAKIYRVDRDTVATWIKKWDKYGDKSLHDQPRSGRPTILNATEKEGSWPRFVKRGGLEVLPYFPAHGREGEAAPLLRRNLLMLLVQVAILMASRTLAKNQPL
jgi:hypothetical protein